MTALLVLDASVAMALVRAEDSSARVRDALGRWATDGVSLIVPAPFWAEIVNSLTKRHGRSGAAVIEALFELDQLSIATVEVDRPLLLAGLDLVERHGLTIHDALYLALARSLGARLATFDRELVAAGGADIVAIWDDRPPERRGHDLRETRAPYGRVAERPVTWPTWPGAGAYLATLRRLAMADS